MTVKNQPGTTLISFSYAGGKLTLVFASNEIFTPEMWRRLALVSKVIEEQFGPVDETEDET